ncbi:uncharacterized protein [Nicotiana sylvestris]|uniref:uncharacterized protein n=1 Tax=Nicotiana sylvestris TaxID=4096 RepID=UPI00388CBA26
MRLSQQEIHCVVRVSPNKQPWFLSTIYASPYYQLRDILWNNLLNLHNTVSTSWLIGGDFNEILEAKERFGGLPINNRRTDNFANFINTCKLVDLGFQGSRYTWTNKRRHGYTILERLDRFLANYDWLNLYPEDLVNHLPRTYSDHCPLLITLELPTTIHHNIFRFETMWASHPHFQQLVHNIWSDDQLLFETIRNFQVVATRWNKQTFGNIFQQKRRILARLGGIQASVHYLTGQFLQNLEIQLNLDYNNLLRVDEEFWKLKSRINWINDGDANTKFFHMSTLQRRCRNRITALKDTIENWVDEHFQLHNFILQYYKSLFNTKDISTANSR